MIIYIEKFLKIWDKSHLNMMYDSFNVLLYQFADILLWIFASMFINDIGLFSFLWCLCLVLVSGWWWLHRMCLGILSTAIFEKSFKRVCVSCSLNDGICLWSHQVLDFCSLENFKSYFQFPYSSLAYSYILFLSC